MVFQPSRLPVAATNRKLVAMTNTAGPTRAPPVTTFLREINETLSKTSYLPCFLCLPSRSQHLQEYDTHGYVPPPSPSAPSTSDKYIFVRDFNSDPAGGVTVETSDYLLFEELVFPSLRVLRSAHPKTNHYRIRRAQPGGCVFVCLGAPIKFEKHDGRR
jgi:hypothetical protein